MNVPFFRPELADDEVEAVVRVLRSGWLTSGPEVAAFEREFAAAVGAEHAIALNSCTAAMHLALEALGLRAGQGVLVPTMTFAATAEVVRYLGAVPILVDCDPVSGLIDFADAEHKLIAARSGLLPRTAGGAAAGSTGSWAPGQPLEVVGMIPVHVGGVMISPDATDTFAKLHDLWVVEDAAHSFPAAALRHDQRWVRCGEGTTAAVTCFSFYANKTITTGEGGMATTQDPQLAERMKLMSLHGLSRDAWERYAGGSWDYQIVAAGFKYNLTDIAAALGRRQLARAEALRARRAEIAGRYRAAFADLPGLELPEDPANRIHAWHLFPVRLDLESLKIDRNTFAAELKQRGVAFSVHWRPLHLHPLYRDSFGWRPEDCPQASATFPRLITLPLFPAMTEAEISAVVSTVRDLCREHRRERSTEPSREAHRESGR